MSWTRAHYAYPCGGGCQNRLKVGAPMYVTKADWHLCETCGTRVMGEAPPADLPDHVPVAQPVLETTVASEFSQFNRTAVKEQLGFRDLDVRQRQSGERE